MKLLYFVLLVVIGFICIRYCKWLVDSTGIRFGFAENFFGPGGTYTAWKIIGIGLIIFAFYYTFGMN